jgi:hypothetical protein
MKLFFERIRNAYNNERDYEREPLFFKAFMWVIVMVWYVLIALYVIIAAVTSPLWIVPYMIYWTKKHNIKKNKNPKPKKDAPIANTSSAVKRLAVADLVIALIKVMENEISVGL